MKRIAITTGGLWFKGHLPVHMIRIGLVTWCGIRLNPLDQDWQTIGKGGKDLVTCKRCLAAIAKDER
jgi:hypothetical protein